MITKKKLDLLIFDLDGTLIDSKADIVTSVNLMLKTLGLPQRNPVEIAGFIGTGVRQLMIDSLGEKHIDKLNEAIKIYKNIYLMHIFDTTVLYPDAPQTLKHFENKKMVIMSNKSIEFSRLALERFGIKKYFLKIYGGDNELCRKPNPCPILNLLKELNVIADKGIIVGDSALDIKAGRGAGISTCGVTYGIGKKEDIIAAKPDFIIDNIGRLKDIIE